MYKKLFNSSIDELDLTDQQKKVIKKLNNACFESYGINDNLMLIAKNKTLKDSVNKLNEMIALKDAEIQEKDNIITQMKDSIALLKSTKNNEFQEAMRRLNRDILTYYVPYKEIENTPMSVELGEIMRDYLKEVFNIVIEGAHLNLDADI